MKYPNIIGREMEISTLERLYKSRKSEFVAIYGRRCIGKSYCKMHNKTHSIQLVMITTMGIARGEHASIVNQSVVLDNLFDL